MWAKAGNRSTSLALAVAVVLAALPVVALGASPAAAAEAGPVILDGTDSGLHGSITLDGSGEPKPEELNSTWRYMLKAWNTMLAGVPAGYANNGKVAVVGAADSTATSNNCGAAAHYIAERVDGGALTVDYFNGDAAIDAFFDQVLAGTARYELIQIVEQNWCGNGMDNAEALVVNANGPAIAAHVNRGGALFSQSQSYGWLSSLFSNLQASTTCGGSSPALTAAGYAQFPGLGNDDIRAPWHNCFVVTSGTFPLTQLALQDGTHTVILGGTSVELPSHVSLAVTPEQPRPGQEICVTATVVDDAQAAVANASVEFSVNGVNTVAPATVLTDAAGQAVFCYTGTEGGDETVVATVADGAGQGSTEISYVWSVVTLAASPSTSADFRGDASICVTATVSTWTDGAAVPTVGATVTFTVDGVNSPDGATATSDAAGEAQYCYDGTAGGVDVLTASVGDLPDQRRSMTLEWAGPRLTVPDLSQPAGQAGKVVPVSLSDFDAATDLYVEMTLSDGGGSLAVDDTGLTLTGLGDLTLAGLVVGFHGTRADVEAALGSKITWTAPAEGRALTLTVTVRDDADPALATLVATKTAQLTAPGAPAVATQPADVTVTEGGDATLTVGATGYPVPTVQWQVSTDEGVTWAPVDGATDATYPFTPTLDQDGAQYRAVLTNGQGSVTTGAATLTVDAAPAPAPDPAPVPTPRRGGGGGVVPPAPEEPEVPELPEVPEEQPELPETPRQRIERVHGAERAATAAKLSAETFQPGVGVVYIVDANSYADGLTGGIAAALGGGPVLLAGRDGLSEETVRELRRLGAGRIVVVGGTAAVSDDVEAALDDLTDGEVERVGGADRYATAALLSQGTFAPGVDVVYLATGNGYADSVSGGPAAALDGAPLLITEPARLPAVIAEELRRLRPGRVVVLGGAAAVGADVLAAAGAFADGDATRIGGADRYATSVGVSQATNQGPVDVLYVATGEHFPDALASTPVVHTRKGALLLVRRDGIPAVVAAEIARLSPRHIVVLGGSGAVTEDVYRQLEGSVAAG